jgi:hypothetical protein
VTLLVYLKEVVMENSLALWLELLLEIHLEIQLALL